MQVMLVVLPRHFAGPDPSSYEPMSVLSRVREIMTGDVRDVSLRAYIYGPSVLVCQYLAFALSSAVVYGTVGTGTPESWGVLYLCDRLSVRDGLCTRRK
jgi:hypothetical protein